jgi:hypothetical protein
LVELVLTRLEEQGVDGTILEDEWRSLKDLDEQEVEYCMAATRLGLDPFAVPVEVSELILELASQLESDLLNDFLDAAHADSLREELDWVLQVTDIVQSSPLTTEGLSILGSRPPLGPEPWEQGLADARELRRRLGLKTDAQVDLTPWVGIQQVSRVTRALQGLGKHTKLDARVLGLAEPKSREGERFAAARALWRFLRPAAGEDEFLITSSRTPPQQAERAFAAEFLAPAAGIEELLGPDTGDPIDLDEVAMVSDYFGVNDWVVEYQAINSLDRIVHDAGLDRGLAGGP